MKDIANVTLQVTLKTGGEVIIFSVIIPQMFSRVIKDRHLE